MLWYFFLGVCEFQEVTNILPSPRSCSNSQIWVCFLLQLTSEFFWVIWVFTFYTIFAAPSSTQSEAWRSNCLLLPLFICLWQSLGVMLELSLIQWFIWVKTLKIQSEFCLQQLVSLFWGAWSEIDLMVLLLFSSFKQSTDRGWCLA